jgi:hypothetical protein
VDPNFGGLLEGVEEFMLGLLNRSSALAVVPGARRKNLERAPKVPAEPDEDLWFDLRWISVFVCSKLGDALAKSRRVPKSSRQRIVEFTAKSGLVARSLQLRALNLLILQCIIELKMDARKSFTEPHYDMTYSSIYSSFSYMYFAMRISSSLPCGSQSDTST